MAFIEPCEVEELLGSCCTCQYTSEGEDSGEDGGEDSGEGCGIPWGYPCQEGGDECAGGYCCRNMGLNFLSSLPHSAVQCTDGQACNRCWDCVGNVGNEDDCQGCEGHSCQGDCTYGYACHYQDCDHLGGGKKCCVPWNAYCMDDETCGYNYWPDYYECEDSYYLCGSTGQPPIPSGHQLESTVTGACCMHEYTDDRWVYIGCEEVRYTECSQQVGTWWGPYTTCGEFEECCEYAGPSACVVDTDCDIDYCCSDFGNCVPCASCDCQCIDNVEEWECCEETNGDGLWHAGETCESYDCEEDCPDDEPECSPNNPCPLCFSCEDGGCVPECEESADCPNNKCCMFGCCEDCDDECQQDLQCSGEQCCKNGSCTYNCPDCEDDDECPGEQECEDGICVDPPGPTDCEDDSGCPQAKCCEDGECVACDPPGPGDDGCMGDGDCEDSEDGTEMCCIALSDDGGNICWPCGFEDGCGCEFEGNWVQCETICGPNECQPGEEPNEYGQCVYCYCCCPFDDPACSFPLCF
jgi:hypothetical protein